MFLSKWFKIIFLVVITLSSLLALWSFSTVGGSGWSTYRRTTLAHSGSAPMPNSMTPWSRQTPGVWPRTDSACSCCPDRGPPLMSGTERARLHTGHLGHLMLRVHHPLLPSHACQITPYRAHHSFKLYLQPEWTHHQHHALQSPGLPSQLCPGFQCGGLGPLHPCVHLCPDAPPWHPRLTHPIKQKKRLHWFMAAIFGHQQDCLP